MSQWYRARDGKSLGPFSFQEILDLVNSKSLSEMDLIFKVGDSEWRPVSDWEEFSNLDIFKSPQKSWMVFRVRNNKEEKLGPFDSDEIRTMLKANELHPEDYVWREGMQDWYQILNIHELRSNIIPPPRKPKTPIEDDISISNEKEIYAQSALDLLKSVKVKDVKQIEELTQTITTTQAKLNSDIEMSPNQNRNISTGNRDARSHFIKSPMNVEEMSLSEKRKELESLMIKIFGEVDLEKESTTITDLKNMDSHINDKVQNLQLTRVLKEQGVHFDTERSPLPKSTAEVDSHAEKVKKLSGFIEKMETEEYFGKSNKWVGILGELNSLFPPGTWLRLLAIFFTLFTLALILMMSTYRDKKTSQQISDFSGADPKNQSKLLNQINLREEMSPSKPQPTKIPPTRIQIQLNSQDSNLILSVSTNGSVDFPVVVEIFANAKEIISSGGYYYKITLKNENPAQLDLKQIKVPSGILNVIVRSGEAVKSLKLNNFKNKLQFQRDLELNKKQMAIWHQKEKRALYSAVSQLGEFAIQLQSLNSLIDEGGSRWQKAYLNLRNRIVQNRSSYLEKVSDRVGSALVYPLVWSRVNELHKILTEIDAEKPAFDYAQFKKDLSLIEEEVSALSLW